MAIRDLIPWKSQGQDIALRRSRLLGQFGG